MMRAVIYTRVSSKEQVQNLSLPTQKKACLEYCERNGLEPDQIFIDEGESAKTADRPEFQKMLAYCRQNKGKIGYVIVYNLSRFSRNTHDHLVVRSYLTGIGIVIRSVTEPIDDTAVGKFLETVLSAHAQLDNDNKSDRTKVGMKAAMQAGRWPYVAPLGYLNDKGPKGQSNIYPDPERAPLIRKAFELYATGLYTRPQVLKMIHDLGLRTRKGIKVSLQTFEGILKNSRYAGIMKTEILDKPEQGRYQPIIDKALFDKVQDILDGKRHTVTPYQLNNPHFPLRRFVRCAACQRPLTASWSRGRTQKYPYYRCPNPQCNAINQRKVELENCFIEYLRQFEPREEYVELFKSIVLDKWKEKQAQTIAQSKALQKRVDDLKTRKEKLIDAFIYKELIDRATYQEQLDKLSQELTLAEIDAHNAKLETFDIEAVLNFAQYVVLNASRLWTEMNLDQKQRFQKVLFPSGVTFDGERFGTAETCIFFKVLQESMVPKSSLASPTGFEPVLLE